MQFIENFQHDLSPNIADWEAILEQVNDPVTDEEFWSELRASEDVPVVANVYQGLILGKIVSAIHESAGDSISDDDLSMIVNARDTHLFVFGNPINSVKDFLAVVHPERESAPRSRG